jgi:adhesin/invasin
VPVAVELLTAADLGILVVNSLVATPPSVLVRDAGGNPLAGVQVTFQLDPAPASGQLTGAVQTTGLNGIATLGSWRVGTTAGTVAGVRVLVQGLDQAGNERVVQTTLVAGPATQIAVAPASVADQPGTPSAPVATLPSVVVRDAFNNPVANATVVFEATPGSGTVTGGTVTTNANGIATVGSWTLPAGTGVTHALIASVNGTSLATVFTATVP